MKNRKIFFVMIGMAAAVTSAAMWCSAEDKKPQQTQAQFLEQLQAKLDHAARRANQPTAEGSSVVGLRGSKQESPSKQLYWKGKKGKEAVSPEEIKEFRGAVEMARAGRNTDAMNSLLVFKEQYPKSALLPDVQEMLTRLNETPKP